MQPIYLDYNATTPVDEQVLEAMLPYFHNKFGNAASSTHPYGWVAKSAVEQAQEQVAKALTCEAQQIAFTSGSTEAINTAIKGVWELYSPRKGKKIITCQTEHKAVLDSCAYLEKFHGAEVTYLPVNPSGLIEIEALEDSLDEQTILVCIMHSNNETGVIQPIQQIAEVVHKHNSIFMSDITQSVGKISCSIDDLGIDLACVSAHKFYGPKGVGALFYRRRNPRVALEPIIHGGGHQRGIRSGTLNVPGIVGLGKAIELATNQQEEYYKHTKQLRTQLEQHLNNRTAIEIIGNQSERLPNTTNIHFKGIDATKMIEITNGAMAVSTGSDCTSANLQPSHVLQAMAFPVQDNFSSIRFSLGKYTTEGEINQIIQILDERISMLTS